ncbi:SDR family NAD(P)-dependent oxidoreductase [Altererythrobacter sp. KTW20L]|uniref:SDR family NAD(P)-dependent oxidoreductase n=1 Tax=Altererythrobacter sp. KTW20L TaxID=2942210 RepID=UPI0020C02565|nr:SDR family NAD(P)-dependent oxidoreductase [Altererythrobacter sp. KTW20L]
MRTDGWPTRAAVFGATGGIGAAVCRVLADGGVKVQAGSRSGEAPKHHLIEPFRFDLTDEASIAAAAASMADSPPDFILVATGTLTLEDGTGPERSLKALDPAAMARSMAVNTIGPAMIARHMLPLMPRDRRWVFAVLSAKVGSISDNGLGGWHSYRASKAALNMLVRNFALEMARTHPQGAVVALHPGTVDTPLSQPFQANVAPGKLFTRRDAAVGLVRVAGEVTSADSGKLLSWDGSEIAP